MPTDFRRRLRQAAIQRISRFGPKTLWLDRMVGLYKFLECHGRLPEKRPQRYSDRLFALRTSGELYDPLRQFVTDKEHVKLYIAQTVGSQYNLQTFQILRTKQEMDALALDKFPCILKPTSGCGRVLICTDRDDPPDRETLRQWLDIDYYRETREQNYRHLRPKIIVEEFFTENGRTPPTDYKIFCFHGRPGFIQVDSGRFAGCFRNFYDLYWNPMPVSIRYPRGEQNHPKPPMLSRMLDLATRLSAPFDFIRVPLYAAPTEVRVGELTNCPGGAVAEVTPPEAEFLLGRFFERQPGA